jgi:DHA2 family multidrug resistance protein-like MFS transporter
MARASLPRVLAEVVDDRVALRTLVASTLALVASGLNPQVFSPFIVGVQAAIRAQPELLAASTLASVLGAGLLLVGGVAADVYRTKRIVQGALVALVVTSVVGGVVPDGPIFLASRFAGVMAAGLVVPFAFAAIAITYTGAARATALGFAYAGFGIAAGAPPILLTITGPGGSDLPAYVAAMAAALVALRATRAIPDLPGVPPSRAPAVARVALWAFGVVALVAGLAAVGSGTDPLRLAIVAVGIVVLVIAGALEARARTHTPGSGVNLRPVTVVLAAGLFIGFAQAVPMSLLPVFFQLILGFGPVIAVAALAPILLALVVAGPVAGWLLPRIPARYLIGGGLVAVGAGNVLVGFVAGRGVSYLLFILPFVLVGGGFVIATTVRTAVIFASVPRNLPGSAAALNEASVTLGSRIGIAAAHVLLTVTTLGAYARSLPAGVEEGAALAPLRDLLVAIGTPALTVLIGNADPSLLGPYADAYVEGISIVHLATGGLAVLAGVIAVAALGWREAIEDARRRPD